jgi:hypothetical protein
VEGLVLDAGHLLQQQDSSDVVASAEHVSMQVPLRSLGIYCPASTVTSLGQHLQAAYVVQRLQLPAAVLSQQPHGNRIPSAQGVSCSHAHGGAQQLGLVHAAVYHKVTADHRFAAHFANL